MKLQLKPMLLAGLLSATVLVAPAAASAHSTSTWKANRQERRCNFYDWRQQAKFSRFDQENRRQNHSLQFLINRENDRNCEVNKNIVEAVSTNGNFKTLTAAVGAAGLTQTLSGGNFTLFAPTDQAFAKLPAGTVESLVANPTALASILTYHAVSGTVPAATAKTLTTAPTVNGASVNISVRSGSLYVNDSRVVLYDIKTTNGIIHVIDTVLIP